MIEVKTYAIFIALYIVIDTVWLIGGRDLHLKTLQTVTDQPNMKEIKIDMKAAGLFYLMAPLAYFLFVKKVATSATDAAIYGAIMGLLLYGTFDLTNKAIFSDRYTWTYAFSDMAWGTFVFGLVCYIVHRIEN